MELTNKIYEKEYFNANGYIDHYNQCINLLPYTTNGVSGHFKKKYSFDGVLGSFFRLLSNDKSSEIRDWETDVKKEVTNYLREKNRDHKTDKLLEDIFQDILFSNESLNVINRSFYRYLPTSGDEVSQKGQQKIAQYLYSLLESKNIGQIDEKEKVNVFSSIIDGIFCNGMPQTKKNQTTYNVLSFVKKMFTQDLSWLWNHEDVVVNKYLETFFYFYTCYSLYQSISRLSLEVSLSDKYKDSPYPLYYLIFGEVASGKRPAVISGWNGKISPLVDNLFADHQTLDLMNCLCGHKQGRQYNEFGVEFDELLSVENRTICLHLLNSYGIHNFKKMSNRSSVKNISEFQEIKLDNIKSLRDVYLELNSICRKYVSGEYRKKMGAMLNEILQYNLLQNRRGNKVLVLNEEMLIFLLALVTKEKRCLLDEMYRRLSKYGILFDKNSKAAIENYLFKLNLLDRKSDSGDAQYVKIIL